MISKDSEMTREVVIRPSSVLLWITIAAGPVSFAVDMQSRFALVDWACGNHRDWALTLIGITAFIAAASSAFIAWSAFTKLNTVDLPEHPGTIESGPIPEQRARFMAMSGFILSAIFALAVVANEIPHIFIHACD